MMSRTIMVWYSGCDDASVDWEECGEVWRRAVNYAFGII
jgi:hypothetical protein